MDEPDLSGFSMEKIRRALQDRNLAKVAVATGLHENTIRAIASGKNSNPTMQTYEKLVQYLFGKQD
jgi:transcriptional regulator with XRE-family HTH domain